MAFQITLNGYAVEWNTSYLHHKRAAQVAHRRYSDPPVKADKLPHLKRRTWIEKGYRVEPTAGFGPVGVYPFRLEADEGIKCAGGGLLGRMPFTGHGVYGTKYYGQGGC